MDNLIEILKDCCLFKGIEEEDIDILLKSIDYRVREYSKGTAIAIEGDKCQSIGVVLSGVVEVQKIYASGKVVAVAKLEVGNVFGEVIIFSNMNTYPSTIMASKDATVLFIVERDIIKLCGINTIVLNNFMGILSNKILMLSSKLRSMSYKTLRQKIAGFIFNEYKKQKNETINLPYSRREMADQLGIPRPSLSRELIKMKEENIIDFYKNTIKIIDLISLEDIFLE